MLASHAHAVAVDEDLVILDVADDAYVCLPGAAHAWSALAAGRDDGAPDGLAATLQAAGLAAVGAQASRRRAPLPRLPAHRIGDAPDARLTARDAARLFAA